MEKKEHDNERDKGIEASWSAALENCAQKERK